MELLTAEQAASLLHLNVKRIQALARAGRIPAARVGRRWLFDRRALQGLLGAPAPAPAASGLESLSARNHLRGVVESVVGDGIMAEVVIRIGDQSLVSIITRSSAERLGLAVGDEVLAVIKSTEVMVAKPLRTGPES